MIEAFFSAIDRHTRKKKIPVFPTGVETLTFLLGALEFSFYENACVTDWKKQNKKQTSIIYLFF